jgi:diguanylate cyclase (GGDEF)-like protein
MGVGNGDGCMAERDNGEAEKAPPELSDLTDDELTPEAQAAMLRLVEEIGRLRDALALSDRRIAHLESVADEDPLTPAVNRRAFLRELERSAAASERYGVPTSVVYLDIDGFKAVNDRFGHAVGDEVLTAVAHALVENVRASDVVGRLGGDEFGVILARADATQGAEKAAALTRVIDAIEIAHDGVSVPFSASAGVYTMGPGVSAADALAAADRAMYESKAAWKE